MQEPCCRWAPAPRDLHRQHWQGMPPPTMSLLLHYGRQQDRRLQKVPVLQEPLRLDLPQGRRAAVPHVPVEVAVDPRHDLHEGHLPVVRHLHLRVHVQEALQVEQPEMLAASPSSRVWPPVADCGAPREALRQKGLYRAARSGGASWRAHLPRTASASQLQASLGAREHLRRQRRLQKPCGGTRASTAARIAAASKAAARSTSSDCVICAREGHTARISLELYNSCGFWQYDFFSAYFIGFT